MISSRKYLFAIENIQKISFCRRIFQRSCIHRAFSSKEVTGLTGDASKWFTSVEVAEMTRKELQMWCKRLGIRANTKTIQMRTELLDFHENVLSNSDILRFPFLPMQNSHTSNLPSYIRNDKLLNNNWNVSMSADQGLGKVRHFKNRSSIDEIFYEDAEFYSDGSEANIVSSGHQLPSVSKILKNTAPKSKLFAISNWTKKQKELYGEDVFRQRMNDIKKKGLDFHRFIHQCLVDRKLNNEVPEKLCGYLASTRKVFDRLSDAIASEKSIQHTYLGYQGKLDTLACYRGNPCVIEWKTSQRKKSSLADCGENPMQLVAYAGAINSNSKSKIQVRHGLLVIAYEDGSPADVHVLDLKQCKHFWQDWLVRLYKFKNQ